MGALGHPDRMALPVVRAWWPVAPHSALVPAEVTGPPAGPHGVRGYEFRDDRKPSWGATAPICTRSPSESDRDRPHWAPRRHKSGDRLRIPEQRGRPGHPQAHSPMTAPRYPEPTPAAGPVMARARSPTLPRHAGTPCAGYPSSSRTYTIGAQSTKGILLRGRTATG